MGRGERARGSDEQREGPSGREPLLVDGLGLERTYVTDLPALSTVRVWTTGGTFVMIALRAHRTSSLEPMSASHRRISCSFRSLPCTSLSTSTMAFSAFSSCSFAFASAISAA